jgi:penicillin-binding protein 2
MALKKTIPSMFHRRLLLLIGAVILVMTVLSGKLMWLSVVQGSELRVTAERQLHRTTWLPTYRGRILDRFGNVLARDRPSYDLSVMFKVIDGTWSLEQARAAAREANESTWGSLGPVARIELCREHLPEQERKVEALWAFICRLGGIDRTELDRRLDDIRAGVQRLAAHVWARQEKKELEQRIRFGKDEEGWTFRPRKLREHTRPHVVLPRIPDEVAFEFRRYAAAFDRMYVLEDSRAREYGWSQGTVYVDRMSFPKPLAQPSAAAVEVIGVADHIVGSMRDRVWKADIEHRPFQDPQTGTVDLAGYRLGDAVGRKGLERVFEDHLRGRRGAIHERKDTGEQERTDPVPGRDLHTTIDIELQRRVQAILSPSLGLAKVQQWQVGWEPTGAPKIAKLPLGTPLNAAAVVIEVETGEILSMVSMPTLEMGAALEGHAWTIAAPWVNRPVEAVYPPGSIIKPIVLAAAVGAGAHRLEETIECTGHHFPNLKTAARCWIYRAPHYTTHSAEGQVGGPLDAVQALARSCNIYFYTLAESMRMRRLVDWLGRFGLGTALDVGLRYREDQRGAAVWVGEVAGELPGEKRIALLEADGELDFATVIMGIGQGPITWTPVHAANAYATLARGGVVRDATVVSQRPGRTQRTADLDVPRPVVAAALEGLRQSVMERYGTGHHIRYADGTSEPIINAGQVTVWAKTGTAQAPPLRPADTNGDGKIDSGDVGIEGLDHAWFVGLVGPLPDRPLYALAVLVEFGGSGGRTAGPIANQIIRALQQERYLPGPSEAGAPHQLSSAAGGRRP